MFLKNDLVGDFSIFGCILNLELVNNVIFMGLF